jgi:hypothetical protein
VQKLHKIAKNYLFRNCENHDENYEIAKLRNYENYGVPRSKSYVRLRAYMHLELFIFIFLINSGMQSVVKRAKETNTHFIGSTKYVLPALYLLHLLFTRVKQHLLLLQLAAHPPLQQVYYSHFYNNIKHYNFRLIFYHCIQLVNDIKFVDNFIIY